MSNNKPLFVATHPRACSTAFERVFMTRRDILKCVHEPFGDAYYFGPERLAERYAEDQKSREASGFSKSTYQTIMERINTDNTEGKRLFIKDMAQYFFPPSRKAVSIAPSLLDQRRGVGTDEAAPASSVSNGIEPSGSDSLSDGHAKTNGDALNVALSKSPLSLDTALSPTKLNGGLAGSHFATKAGYSHTRQHSNPPSPQAPFPTFEEVENPTVVPTALLEQFHFAFLIRHPRYSIPSYYRCCIPPLDEMTGFYNFRPDEAGYDELRRFFDYLRASNQIGPARAGERSNGQSTGGAAEICMIDADDLLDCPEEMMKTFCESVGINWSSEMLNWNSDEDKAFAKESFEKWRGFHEDAIHSNDLKPREHKHAKSDEELYDEWTEKYGKQGADLIKQTVADCIDDYEYLKQFCVKVGGKS